jgi:hypothetical protein
VNQSKSNAPLAIDLLNEQIIRDPLILTEADFTLAADLPPGDPGDSIRKGYASRDLTLRTVAMFLNAGVTSKKRRIRISQTLVKRYWKADPNVNRDSINGDEYERIINRVLAQINNPAVSLFICLEKSSPKGSIEHRAGLYEFTPYWATLLGLPTNENKNESEFKNERKDKNKNEANKDLNQLGEVFTAPFEGAEYCERLEADLLNVSDLVGDYDEGHTDGRAYFGDEGELIYLGQPLAKNLKVNTVALKSFSYEALKLWLDRGKLPDGFSDWLNDSPYELSPERFRDEVERYVLDARPDLVESADGANQ